MTKPGKYGKLWLDKKQRASERQCGRLLQTLRSCTAMANKDRDSLIHLVRTVHRRTCQKIEEAREILGDRETLTAQEVIALQLLNGYKVQKRAREEREDVHPDHD